MSGERYVGFTGTRHEPTEKQKNALVDALTGFREGGMFWMRNGDCLGADEYAGFIWKAIGGRVHLHPPSNPKLRAYLDAEVSEKPVPYLARNRHIVDGSDLLVAVPFEAVNQFRGGTWSTIHYADSRKLPTMIILPDGRVDLKHWPSEAIGAAA